MKLRGLIEMSDDPRQIPDPDRWGALIKTAWTDVEHDEIMRLHIIDGLTIDHAQRVVFDKRME